MRRKKLLLFSLILLCFSTPAHAQLWSGIIDPSRAIDWAANKPGVVGGIPNRTTICSTLSPGVTAAQINSAIAACSANQVVFLNAGTYNLSAGIDFQGRSNVTLRGAGADQTKLVFTGFAGCGGSPKAAICVKGASSIYTDNAIVIGDWTAGFTQGATQITLSSVSGLSVGQILVLDQCNDGLTGASCTGTETDTGDVWNCAQIGVCSIEGSTSGENRLSVRQQEQIVKVTAINGNVVTISPGLYMPNWRSGQSPQAWTWGSISQTAVGDGVENLSIDDRNAGSNMGVSFYNAYGSWVKGIRIVGPSARSHIWFFQGAHNEVRDSYFYGSGGASVSYGLEFFKSSDGLFINNILQHVVAPIISNKGAGNVAAYNYLIDMSRTDYPTAMGQSLTFHGGGVGMVLYEGNQATTMVSDTFHGGSDMVTIFRNHLPGYDPVNTPQATSCVHPISIWSFHRYYNVIGNVLGLVGTHSVYEVATPTAPSNVAVYNLGSRNACGNSTNPPDDPLVKATLFRWGNYDVVTGTARFLASEVPSGLAKYANSVPGSQTLPASFFLSAKPSWWGTPWGNPPWPAVGPDVTGGNVIGYGGRVWKNPARLCYENSALDGVNLFKVFNATRCYPSGTQPAPPANLRVQ